MKTGTFMYTTYGRQHTLPVRDCPNPLAVKAFLEELTGAPVQWREAVAR